MEIILKDRVEYIKYKKDRANIIFFTARNNTDFNMAVNSFPSIIDKVKDMFKLENIGYSKQIHSDVINIYDGNVKLGDGLITNRVNLALGIFTADCVPVMIYDLSKNICAAVHSGWKGTYSKIAVKAIRKMIDEFGCDSKDICVYIGPHIRGCCYEVGKDLIDKFSNSELYQNYQVTSGNKLILEECIIAQCLSEGLIAENIFKTNLCTYCSGENGGLNFHSYRKYKENSGRMLSLIYLDK